MKNYSIVRLSAWGTLAVWAAALSVLGVTAIAQEQAGTEEGVQVLTRGPIHEAFAKASMTGATAGIVIAKAPPDPVSEMPPDQRPEGSNVAWIPGYWSWDDDRNDFIWISGVWRDLPPGRQWVPGYWTQVQGGWQWISGFWGDVAQTDVTYLPPPPEPLEAGPSSPAPAPDNVWAPGCWVWQETRYDWQPGYWVVQRPDWIWVSAHYVWTPRGCVYVPGYWDHDIAHRGMMFAPVYYERPVYAQPNYFYSPSIIIDLGVVAACLFVQPRTHNYYFGDYYDHRYEERGYYPWYSKEVRRYGDDPIYTHYRAQQLRGDPDWDTHVHEQFNFRREHVDARPPQTLALQVNLIKTQKAGGSGGMLIGRSFAEAAQIKIMPLHLAPVNPEERKQFEARGQDVHKFQAERAKLELVSATSGKPGKGPDKVQAVKVQMRASPVSGKPLANLEAGNAPPPMPATPKPQAAEERGRPGQTENTEVITGRPQLQESPAKGEAGTSTVKEKQKRGGNKPEVVKTPPKAHKIEPAPSGTEAKPKPIASTPEATTLESKPHVETQTVPSKRESVRVKTESNPPALQNVEKPKPKPESVESKPQVKPRSRQIQNSPKAVESPKGLPTNPESPKPDLKTQSEEPKPQGQHSNIRQPNTRQPVSGADKSKEKKNEVR